MYIYVHKDCRHVHISIPTIQKDMIHVFISAKKMYSSQCIFKIKNDLFSICNGINQKSIQHAVGKKTLIVLYLSLDYYNTGNVRHEEWCTDYDIQDEFMISDHISRPPRKCVLCRYTDWSEMSVHRHTKQKIKSELISDPLHTFLVGLPTIWSGR